MSDRPRILVADGAQADRELAALVLRHALDGYDVEAVGDPMVFAERLTYPDLAAVVTEYQLGWTSGIELAATISRLHPRCAIVLFTGESDTGALAEAVRHGLDGYVVKNSAGFLALPGAVRDALARATRRVTPQVEEEHYRALIAELEDRAAQLARSNSELQQFSYVISHDLQEPLHLIAHYAQLLAEAHGAALPTDAHRWLANVMTSAARMQAMIDDVLEYARVSTTTRAFALVDVGAAAGEALANLKAAIDESGAEVTVHRLPRLAADSRQMVQVFQNLIGNAIKFRRGAAPHVHVSANEVEDAWVFTVTDDGIGIPREQLDRVFGLFQRLHGPAEYPGTGIGLAICKRIVERHGGKIWVASRSGEGSTFSFSIPKRLPAAAESSDGLHDGGADGRQTAARSAR